MCPAILQQFKAVNNVNITCNDGSNGQSCDESYPSGGLASFLNLSESQLELKKEHHRTGHDQIGKNRLMRLSLAIHRPEVERRGGIASGRTQRP